jgi:hypothetical protein
MTLWLTIASVCLAVCGWLRAYDAERDLELQMRTVYAHPTPEFEAALAAGNAADEQGVPVASGASLKAIER